MGKLFTLEEDQIIMSASIEATTEGIPLKIAFLKVADDLSRPLNSVLGRYKRMTSTSIGFKKELSESERIIYKLRALGREKERSAEKVNLYKDKFLNLQSQHDDLKREYRNLQSQHQVLIDTVKKVIGDDEDKGIEARMGKGS